MTYCCDCKKPMPECECPGGGRYVPADPESAANRRYEVELSRLMRAKNEHEKDNMQQPNKDEIERVEQWQKESFLQDTYAHAAAIYTERKGDHKDRMVFRGITVDGSWPKESLLGLAYYQWDKVLTGDWEPPCDS